MRYIISYDLGTGGTKASLFDEQGTSCAHTFVSCDTFYPRENFREQRPEDWWESVKVSTRLLLEKTGIDPECIQALAVSGHSLGAVPMGMDGSLLAEYVPVWNDARAGLEAEEFFRSVDENTWYETTGNGFPAPLYAVFKMMWYKKNQQELYEKTKVFIGTKDYVNYKLTGVLCTDASYASGSGVYSLEKSGYVEEYIEASGISGEKFPDIYPSTHIIGTVLPEAAEELGLWPGTQVACGGVDNACMALGAACFMDGDVYTSLGTSAWIAVSSGKPIVNRETRPYVFAHCIPGKYVSSVAIFSAGNSFRWVRNTLCPDYVNMEKDGECDAYDRMTEEAEGSPLGANRLIFNPSLAGGTSLDKSQNIRGLYAGLDLRHTRADMIRASMEGISMNLRLVMDSLERELPLSEDMLLVGGGGKSRFWREIFAAVYEKNMIETNVGEDAGSLGAAAVAAVGCGMWKDFEIVKELHRTVSVAKPDREMADGYRRLLPVFRKISQMASDMGDMLSEL